MKLDILAIAAHPDDVELSCSGTIAKEIAAGKKVGILDLTRGELGSRGSAEIRDKEAEASSKVLGLAERFNIAIPDGFFEVNEDSLLEVITQIRRFQPDIVLANAIEDRHPDHGRGSELASRACFLSGLLRIETTWNGEKQMHWRPKTVYHYIQDRYMKPDVVVDVSGFMDKKMESILAFKSQFYNPEDENQVSTPISGKEFLEFVKSRSRQFGREIGVEFGEGFTVERTIGTESLFDLI